MSVTATGALASILNVTVAILKSGLPGVPTMGVKLSRVTLTADAAGCSCGPAFAFAGLSTAATGALGAGAGDAPSRVASERATTGSEATVNLFRCAVFIAFSSAGRESVNGITAGTAVDQQFWPAAIRT